MSYNLGDSTIDKKSTKPSMTDLSLLGRRILNMVNNMF